VLRVCVAFISPQMKPAEYLVQDGKLRKIRHEETLESHLSVFDGLN
jgi:diaminopimelate decarboxylase